MNLKKVQNDNFSVKNEVFICEFKICGPKWRNVFTRNNEGNQYIDKLQMHRQINGQMNTIFMTSYQNVIQQMQIHESR
jgi:hypothetical protein